MRRTLLICFNFLLICFPLKSQDWIRSFTNNDFAFPRWVIETYDKGYLLVDNETVYSWLIKTDINGIKLWEKRIGNAQDHIYLGNLEQTDDGGFILGGGLGKYDPAGNDPVIIKLNPCGELEWCSVINTIGKYDYASRVKQTPEGNYVLSTLYSDPNPSNRIQLFKFDIYGNLLWKHNYHPDSLVWSEDDHDVLVDNNGYLISASCYYPDPVNPTIGYERPYYIKTDTAGNLLWWLVYGSENGFHGFIDDATIRSSTGNFYSIGWHSNYCDTPVLVKCTSNGQESYFQDLIPGVCPGGVSGVNWVNDTTLIMCAGGTLNGNTTTRWMKTDTFGIMNYYKEVPVWMGNTYHTARTFDNKFISVARVNDIWIYLYKLNSDLEYDSVYTQQFTYDSLCPGGVVSDTINPDCDLIVNIDEPKVESELSLLKVYPNPASESLTIEFPKYLKLTEKKSGLTSSSVYYQWKSTILEVYDLNGKNVYSKEILKEQQQLVMDVSGWNCGMYYFRLVYGDKMVAGEKVIIE